jgi:hypothetical protein
MNIRNFALIGTAVLGMSHSVAQTGVKLASYARPATEVLADSAAKKCSCQAELGSIYTKLVDLGKMPTKSDIVKLNGSFKNCESYGSDVAQSSKGVNSRYYVESDNYNRKAVSEFNNFNDGTMGYRAGLNKEQVIVSGTVDKQGKCKFVSVTEGFDRKVFLDTNGDGQVDKIIDPNTRK